MTENEDRLRRITLLIPENVSTLLKREAKRRDTTVNSYLRKLLSQNLGHPIKVGRQGKHGSLRKAESLAKEIEDALNERVNSMRLSYPARVLFANAIPVKWNVVQ